MNMSLRFTGGKELAANLNRLPPRTKGRVAREILKEAAEPMRQQMAGFAPRAPGAPDIADNIVISSTRSVLGQKLDENQQAVAVGPARVFKGSMSVMTSTGVWRKSRSFYGLFLEFGTTHMGAQPFARPAFDGSVRGALQMIRSKLWDVLSKRGLVSSRPASPEGTGLL